MLATPPLTSLLINEGSSKLEFHLQPIVNLHSSEVSAFEALFRGQRNFSWAQIDAKMLHHLSYCDARYPRLFVNLSNESVLAIPETVFTTAAARHDLVFEISEHQVDVDAFGEIVAKVNALTDKGVRFAIDDFGNGQDGLQRLHAYSNVKTVKIDGSFLKTSMRRAAAAKDLASLIANWRARGIETIAECVESGSCLEFAMSVGCAYVQGWHIDSLVERNELHRLAA